jgi:gliding motility-associated-like protein
MKKILPGVNAFVLKFPALLKIKKNKSLLFIFFIVDIANVSAQLCPNLTVPANISICQGQCANLSASIDGGYSSNSYLVQSIPYTPYPYSGGTGVSVNTDDVWSGIINLPFCFNYFGNTYNSCILGSNGQLSFDLGNVFGYNNWITSSPLPSTADMPGNTICAVYRDIDPSVSGAMRYYLTGNAPCRALVVYWDDIALYNCNNPHSTFQLVLHEGTNYIDVFIQNSSGSCGWNSSRGITGIQNAAGTVAFCPPGRNMGGWTAINEGWRFIPNGAPNYTFNWTGPSGSLGSSPNITVCPTVNTTYTAYASMSTCFGPISYSATTTVYYNLNPTANFNFSVTPCDNTKTVSVVSTSSLNSNAPISNYSWTWGDSSPNSGSNATTHTYPTSGIYPITLVVTNTANCSNSITQTVSITQKPTSDFTVASVCSGITPTFVNLSSTPAGANSYTWNFGNNSPLNYSASPTYSYPISGNYSVTLFVTNTDGCSDVISKPLSIYGRAVPNFSVPSVCFNSQNHFTDLSITSLNPNTASITTWVWNFAGSGLGPANVQNPIYTYTNTTNLTLNTVYTPTLFITTANGCKDSISLPVTVYSLPTPNFTSDSVCLTKATTLMDVSNSNGNPFSNFAWDFNQDGIVDLNNLNLINTYVFPNFGNTPVTYTVYTNPIASLNCQSVITKTVWVHPLPINLITNTNTCIDTQPSKISGATSSIAIGSIANYAWDYGNGNISLTNTLAPTSFSYNAAGNYIVTLTLTSNAGCTTVSTKMIEVWEKPYANFHYTKTCLGKTTTLTAHPLPVSGVITTYNWDYNNSPFTIEATGPEVYTNFATAGTQTLNMVLTTNKGCKNTIAGNLYINYNPKPNFTAPKRAGCTDLYVNIKDSSAILTGPAKNDIWQWYFGNDQTAFLPNNNQNTIIYTNSSNTEVKSYDVKLILITDSGCVDSIKKENYITVYPKPKADFDWQGKSGDILIPQIDFTNTSIGYSKFAWYFNDGLNITDSIKDNPSYYYDTDLPRDFNVFLAVRSPYGCKDTISKYVDIGPEFTFYIPNAFTPNSDGNNDTFTGKGIGIKTYNMWIFDRWGEKIFHTDDLKNGWDGSVKGKEPDEKTDVYIWKVVVTDLTNKQHEYAGHVTLYK